ncbi:MAG TPA: TRAP transporter small permease [Burkholderiales bacterium]|nr:TRAP transporter small permease [Burkholderiales bacterium]
MRSIARGVQRAAALLSAVAVAIVALLPFPLFYDALARKAGAPTVWVFDVTLYALIAGAFLANAYALKHGNHFRVHILLELFPRWRRAFDDLALASVALFGFAIAYGGGLLVHYSYVNAIRSASLFDVALYLPQAVVPLGGLALALQALAMIVLREAPSELSDFE